MNRSMVTVAALAAALAWSMGCSDAASPGGSPSPTEEPKAGVASAESPHGTTHRDPAALAKGSPSLLSQEDAERISVDLLTSAGGVSTQTSGYDNSHVLQFAIIVEVNWVGSGTFDDSVARMMPDFYADFAASSYAAQLRTYRLAASKVQFVATPYTIRTPIPASVTDGNIQGMLNQAIRNNQLPLLPGAIYAVHLAQGVSNVTNGSGNPACTGGSNGWCGYHGSGDYQLGTGKDSLFLPYTYSVIPDIASPPCANFCSFTNGGPYNDTTKIVSHELIETLTDPWGDNWWTRLNGTNGVTVQGTNGQEIGDVCNGGPANPLPVDGGSGFTTMPSGNGPPWFVQSPWIRYQGGCVLNAPWSWETEAYKNSGFATIRGPYHIDLFSTGVADQTTPPGSLASYWWDVSNGSETGASGWTAIGPSVFGGPPARFSPGAIVGVNARGPGLIDVLGNGIDVGSGDDVVMTTWWDQSRNGASWNYPYPTSFASTPAGNAPPSVVSRDASLVDVFFTDASGALVQYEHTGPSQQWGTWSTNVVQPAGLLAPGTQVSAISRFHEQLDVFATDPSGVIWTWWWNSASGWGGPVSLPGITGGALVSPGAPVAAAARYPYHIDVFATDPFGVVQSYWYDAFFNGGGWNALQGGVLVGAAAGAPVAVDVQGSWHLDVFTTRYARAGTPTGLLAARFDEGNGLWLPYAVPNSAGAYTPGQPLHALSRMRGAIDVFGLNGDGSVVTQALTRSDIAQGTGGQWSSPLVLQPFTGISAPTAPSCNVNVGSCGGDVTFECFGSIGYSWAPTSVSVQFQNPDGTWAAPLDAAGARTFTGLPAVPTVVQFCDTNDKGTACTPAMSFTPSSLSCQEGQECSVVCPSCDATGGTCNPVTGTSRCICIHS